jgi:hypothetical protein
MRLRRPRWAELRPVGDQQKHRQALEALDGQAQKLLRGRVAPVHVLIGEQHRLRRREPFELLEQRRQRQLLLALRSQIERRVAAFRRQAEQRRDQRHRLLRPVGAARQEGFELGESRLGRLVARESGRALHLLDQRMQRTGRVVRRALVEQAYVGLVLEPRAHFPHQTRLANSGLAGQQDDMPLAVFGLLPPAQQQRDLLVTADQRRQARRLPRLEAPFGLTLAFDPPGGKRLGKSL